jgi:hypothetical protein
MMGAHSGTVGWGTVLQAGRLQVQFLMMSLEFFIEKILPLHLGPGVDSASNRNEYQQYFLGGEGDWCLGLTTLPPSCVECLAIWEYQPPRTLRSVQACNGIALPSTNDTVQFPDTSDNPSHHTIQLLTFLNPVLLSAKILTSSLYLQSQVNCSKKPLTVIWDNSQLE